MCNYINTITMVLHMHISSSLVDRLHPLYSDLLKRMDDSSDEIRIAVTKTLTAYVRSAEVNYIICTATVVALISCMVHILPDHLVSYKQCIS